MANRWASIRLRRIRTPSRKLVRNASTPSRSAPSTSGIQRIRPSSASATRGETVRYAQPADEWSTGSGSMASSSGMSSRCCRSTR